MGADIRIAKQMVPNTKINIAWMSLDEDFRMLIMSGMDKGDR